MTSGPVPVCFSELSTETKLKFLEKWGCFRGIRTTPADRPATSPLQIASLARVSETSVGNASDFLAIVCEEVSSELSVETAYSNRNSWYLRSGFTLDCLPNATTPWSPAFDIAEPREWTNQIRRTAYTTANLYQTRLRLQLRPADLLVADDFATAVREALSKPDEKAQVISLRAVFDQWGHVLPSHLELGGSISATRKATCSSQADVLMNERALQSLLAPQPWPFGDPNLEGESPAEFATTFRGGNHQPLDYPTWIQSLGSSDNWEVIRIVSVIPTSSLLDYETQQQVQALQLELSPSVSSTQPDQTPSSSVTEPSLIPVYHLSSPFTSNVSGQHSEAALSLPLSGAFALSAWIRRVPDNVPGLMCAFSIDSPRYSSYVLSAGLYNGHFFVHILSANQISPEVVINTEANVGEQAALRWVHILIEHCVDDVRGESLVLHVDGQENTAAKLERPIASPEELRIVVGCRKYSNGLINNWLGQVQNLRVYPRALSMTEKLAEANDINRPSL